MFDQSKAKWFLPSAIMSEDGTPEVQMCPMPDGEMRDKLLAFHEDSDPYVFKCIVATCYPSPTSMVN